MTDDERRQFEVTLATLRTLAARTLEAPAGNDHARGYRTAMQDVQAILDKHGAPVDEPVRLGTSSP